MPTPFSWQRPPRPDNLVLPDGSAFRGTLDRTWHRSPWAIENTTASLGLLLPGWADIFVSVHLKTRGTPVITISIIQAALRLLRFERPIVASKLAHHEPRTGSPVPFGQSVLVYETPASEADVEGWLSDVTFDHADALQRVHGDVKEAVALVRRELGSALPAYRPYQLEVHHIPARDGASGALILRCGHVAFDGLGSFEILDALILKIGRVLECGVESQGVLLWGKETDRLAPPAADITRIPWSPEVQITEFPMAQRLLRRMASLADSSILTIHTPNPWAPPTCTGFIHRRLPREITEALIAAARLQECTFFAVAYAAAVLSTLTVRRPSDTERSTVSHWFIPHNLRSSGALAQTDNVASALGVVVLDPGDLTQIIDRHKSPSLDDLWTLARDAKTQMDDQRAEMETVALWGEAMQVGSLDLSLAQRLSKRDLSRITNPQLCSLGVVDGTLAPRHGQVFVSEPCMTVRTCYASPPLGPYVALHAFTWQGELHVDVSYPEAVVGTNEEQEDALRSGGEAAGSLLAWVNTFMETLKLAAGTHL